MPGHELPAAARQFLREVEKGPHAVAGVADHRFKESLDVRNVIEKARELRGFCHSKFHTVHTTVKLRSQF